MNDTARLRTRTYDDRAMRVYLEWLESPRPVEPMTPRRNRSESRNRCECHYCGTALPPNTGLIAYGFCSDDCRTASNDAARRGLTPSMARTEMQAKREAA